MLSLTRARPAVFIVTVSVREVTPEGDEVIRVGKLYLVDLAGSENITRCAPRPCLLPG